MILTTTATAIFLLGNAVLVFGAESSIRSLKRHRFQPRAKWSTPLCLFLLAILFILAMIPTFISQIPRRCLGQIVNMTFAFALVATTLIGFMMLNYIIMAIVITCQLRKSYKIDNQERVAASWVVYHLILAVIMQVSRNHNPAVDTEAF